MTVNPTWLAQFGSECWYCGTTLTYRTAAIDHRIPIRRGGSNSPSNRVPCCGKCNRMKKDRTEAEFIRYRPIFAQRHRNSLVVIPGSDLDIPVEPASLEEFDSHNPEHRIRLEVLVTEFRDELGLPDYLAIEEAMNYFAKTTTAPAPPGRLTNEDQGKKGEEM